MPYRTGSKSDLRGDQYLAGRCKLSVSQKLSGKVGTYPSLSSMLSKTPWFVAHNNEFTLGHFITRDKNLS